MDVIFSSCAGLEVQKRSVMAWRITAAPTGQQADGLVALSGATAMMGVAGRASLQALSTGRADPATMAELANGRLRRKIPVLAHALTGLRRDHPRRWLAIQWAHMAFVDEQIDALSTAMTRGLTDLSAAEAPAQPAAPTAVVERTPERRPAGPPRTFTRAIALLDTIPGIDRRGAERWGAATGIDMARFGTAARLAAWAGVAPGQEESAGQQRSGRTRPGHPPRRPVLTQMAHAAAPTTGTSLSTLSQRLAARRGRNRALMAVAHSRVVSAWERLARQQPDQELGANYVDEQPRHHLVDRLIRRIEQRGDHGRLEPLPTTAA
jgi:transposase